MEWAGREDGRTLKTEETGGNTRDGTQMAQHSRAGLTTTGQDVREATGGETESSQDRTWTFVLLQWDLEFPQQSVLL